MPEPGSLLRPSSSLTYWMCVDDFFNWNINDWLTDCHHIYVLPYYFFWFRGILCFFEIFLKKEKKFRVQYVNKFYQNGELFSDGEGFAFSHLLEGPNPAHMWADSRQPSWVHVSRCTQLLKQGQTEQMEASGIMTDSAIKLRACRLKIWFKKCPLKSKQKCSGTDVL